MLFNSVEFILFFPFVLLVYFIIPKKVKYLWLLACSYYFYMCWNPKYVFLLLGTTVITYLGGLGIGCATKLRKERTVKIVTRLSVILSLVLCLSLLGFYKYFDFFIDNINIILRDLHVSLLNPGFQILLPVGISFYTFQALSYTIDVYRGDIEPEKNFFRYALFVSFFPQLVAGPIERSKNLLCQLKEPHFFDVNKFKRGAMLMLWGYFQKMVIADRIAVLVDRVYGDYYMYGSTSLLIATVLFGIQVYCDFSSYSDIAIGAAEILGIKLMQNFKQPYFSLSVAEFWRRWHISLSSWFKDYLYIPLGGSHRGKLRKYINIMVVFLVSGFWHGADWTFVIWGGLNGIYQVIGDITRPLKDKGLKLIHLKRTNVIYKFFAMIVTFVLVDSAWIFFRAGNIKCAITIVDHIIHSTYIPFTMLDLGLGTSDFVVLCVSLGILFLISTLRYNEIPLRETVAKQLWAVRWIVYILAVFIVLIFGYYGDGYQATQFIYFQF